MRVLVAALLSVVLFSCSVQPISFNIVSASENQSFEAALVDFAHSKGVDLHFVYKGSVDIMDQLMTDTSTIDAVWPASGLWTTLGDTGHAVKDRQNVFVTPVVLGVQQSLAQKWGWTQHEVTVSDILAKVQTKELQFLMTSATQSNSGASAYLGFLSAVMGNPEVLTEKDLDNPKALDRLRGLLSGVNRSAGSSGWLKDLFLSGNYSAMINYEALVIEANKALVAQGKEPLQLVYPVDGLALADSQLGFVDHGDIVKARFYQDLKRFLTGPMQPVFLASGRRVGIGGTLDNADPSVFNPAWGISSQRILSPIKLPSAGVIFKALNLYQSELRKPSLTVFCLDYSGSMEGDRNAQLMEAMGLLLTPERAARYFLQPSRLDLTIVIPFSTTPSSLMSIQGNKPGDLAELLRSIQNLPVGGKTDIYSPIILGLQEIQKRDLTQYVPAIILMTDGESNVGVKFEDFQAAWAASKTKIPIFPILFGDGSLQQMRQLSDTTQGSVFDGTKNLVEAMKKAKGYN